MSSLDDIAAEALAAPRSPFSRNDAPTPDPTHSMVESFRCDMLNAARKASSTVHQDADRYNVELEPLVRRACQVDAFREVLLEMRGRDAQCVVDAIEQFHSSLSAADVLRRRVLHLLVKFCSRTSQLPASLFIHGVNIGDVRDPCSTGGFADIYRGKYRQMEVAVKKLRFLIADDRAAVHKSFCKEALVWKQLNHPNVLTFLGVDTETFASTNYLCMVSPWMTNGTLSQYMTSAGYAPEYDSPRVLNEVASGLTYLHAQKVVHADIHGDNVLINSDGRAVLADFGLVSVGEISTGKITSASGTGGHIRYMAPERIDPETPSLRSKPAVDVYAFACLCYMLYSGRHPFHEHPAAYTVLLKVMNGERPARPQMDSCRTPLTDNVWFVIEQSWAQEPERRPTMMAVQDWLHQSFNPDCSLKTCNGVSRVRRRSCVPCAESKIKCDLASPCDKCTQRGRECVASPPRKKRRTAATLPLRTGEDGTPPPLGSDADGDHSTDGHSGDTPSLSEVHDWRSRYGSSVTDSVHDQDEGSTAYTYASSPVGGTALSQMYSSNVFNGLFDGIFTQPVAPTPSYAWLHQPAPAVASSRPAAELPPLALPTPVPQPAITQHQHTGYPVVNSNAPPLHDIIFGFGEYEHQPHAPAQAAADVNTVQNRAGSYAERPAEHAVYNSAGHVEPEPTQLELDHYMSYFWTIFTPQMPLLHAPTFSAHGKPSFLLSSMRACGALYVRTRRAGIFITQTLVAERARISTALAAPGRTRDELRWLFTAMALLQAVGMFHEEPAMRASHLSFQANLVDMIRRHRIVEQNAAWRPLVHNDPASLQAAWVDWAERESEKRAIMLSLVHDCCNQIYFGLPSSFSSDEFNLYLPTDCPLWTSPSAYDWATEQRVPSEHGPPELRLYGYPLQRALVALSDPRRLAALTGRAKLNPLALWVLAHCVLRHVFAMARDACALAPDACLLAPDASLRAPPFCAHWVAPAGEDASMRLQLVLRAWLESWLGTPEAAAGRELPFMCDSLPFYWLGQISLLALQEGVPPFDGSTPHDPAARFLLVKHWLRRARLVLRRAAATQTAPHEATRLWNEMMKIRLQAIGTVADGHTPEDEDGLLGFFDSPELPSATVTATSATVY